MSPPGPARALVTGGARRIGRGVCLALAQRGCAVRFTFHRSERDAAELLGVLERDHPAPGGAAHSAARLDLSDPGAVEGFAAREAEEGRGPDILVHNASVYSATPLAQATAESALLHYRVNALAPLLLTKRLAPSLARSGLPGGGAVVAMLDIHASGRARANFSAYAMSKSALEQMVLTLARELAPRVRVNGVALGVAAFPETGPESEPEARVRYLQRVPLGRSGTPEEAAEAVRWLALDASYTTGAVLRVDGGRALA